MSTRNSAFPAVRAIGLAVALAASASVAAQGALQQRESDGVVRVKSAYPLDETIDRIKRDVADKGITFFLEVDQAALARAAGIDVRPSTLLVFGNPPLGTQFLRANPLAGLDWPVRLLVLQDERGEVWAAYTDFHAIAARHRVKGADAEPFAKASTVIASIASSIGAR